MIDSGMGPMQEPMHEGLVAPPAWMSKVHDQLYRNVHRHTLQPLHTRNLLPSGTYNPQAMGHFPPQPQLLDQMPPQLPWNSPR